MGVRTTVVSASVAAALCFPMAGVAVAQVDRDCDDFATQADAQAFYNRNPADPSDLDRIRHARANHDPTVLAYPFRALCFRLRP